MCVCQCNHNIRRASGQVQTDSLKERQLHLSCRWYGTSENLSFIEKPGGVYVVYMITNKFYQILTHIRYSAQTITPTPSIHYPNGWSGRTRVRVYSKNSAFQLFFVIKILLFNSEIQNCWSSCKTGASR